MVNGKADACGHLTVDMDLQCSRPMGHPLAHGCYDRNRKDFYKWTDTGLPIPATAEDVRVITPEPAPATSILDEAASIVGGARATDYGEGAENSLSRVARYWSAYLDRDVKPRDVANLMILLKVGREGHKPKRDNHLDIAGYVALAEQCEDRL